MLNTITLVGRLTRDPELRQTNSGKQVASYTLACDESRKGPNGEKNTIFISVSVFGAQAEIASKYLRKGHLSGVVGRLTQRKYTNKDGINVTTTEIIADHIELMESKASAEANGETSDAIPDIPTRIADAPTVSNGNTDELDVVDDELPF